MSQTSYFAQPGATPWVEIVPGNRRRVLVHTDNLMQVEFSFARGAVGTPHSHPHVQSSYVAEGCFEVTIAGLTQTIAEGGSFIVPSGLVHSVKALEAGRLIDSFTPAREDFL